MDQIDPQKDALSQSDLEQTNENKKDASDNLTPDHPRFKDVIAEKNELKESVSKLTTQLEDLQTKVAERSVKTGEDEAWTQDEIEAGNRIAKLLKEQHGIVTQDTLAVQERKVSLDRLDEKYPGSNGLPKFKATEVVSFAKANGLGDNYEAAYREMHHQAIVQYEAKKLANNPEIPDSERAEGSDRRVTSNQFSEEQIANMSDEEYERNRNTIHAQMRASMK